MRRSWASPGPPDRDDCTVIQETIGPYPRPRTMPLFWRPDQPGCGGSAAGRGRPHGAERSPGPPVHGDPDQRAARAARQRDVPAPADLGRPDPQRAAIRQAGHQVRGTRAGQPGVTEHPGAIVGAGPPGPPIIRSFSGGQRGADAGWAVRRGVRPGGGGHVGPGLAAGHAGHRGRAGPGPEAAGLAAPGAGAAVTGAAQAGVPSTWPSWASRPHSPATRCPALARELGRLVPPDAAAAVHQGATSQDIIDTAAMLLARQAARRVAADLAAAAAAAARLAAGHRDTRHDRPDPAAAGRAGHVRAGRGGLAELAWTRPARSWPGSGRSRLAVQFGGAAGTLAALDGAGPAGGRPAGQRARPGRAHAALAHRPAADHRGRRGLRRRHARVLGKIARDVTLLAQSEVAEVREGGGGAAGGAVRRPCRTSSNPVARDRRARLHPAGPRAARHAGQPRPSRNTSVRPAPGTPSGSR